MKITSTSITEGQPIELAYAHALSLIHISEPTRPY